jgi:hypothetical protein
MAKQWIMICSAAFLMGLISGCGYKAPPYYEKPLAKAGFCIAL